MAILKVFFQSSNLVISSSSRGNPRAPPPTTTTTTFAISSSSSSSSIDLSRRSTSSSTINVSRSTIISLPKLKSSFGPASLHPLHETVRSECEPWILDIASPPSPSHRQFLLDCLVPRYVCRLFPTASRLPRLVAVTKLYAWLILADDIEDEDINASDAAFDSEAWSTSVLSVLEKYVHRNANANANANADPAAQRGGGRSGELVHALAEIWREISREMPGDTKDRFLVATREHLDGVKLQSAHRSRRSASTAAGSHGQLLSVAQYMAIRRPASALPQGMELLPYVLGMEDDHVVQLIHHHPLLTELRSLVVDHMSICNDVFSCGVEMAKGDYFNLPCLLYGNGVAESMQQAVEYAAEMAENVDSRCMELVNLIYADTQLMDFPWRLTVKAYVDTMLAWMAGTIEWGHESARYRTLPASTS